MNSTAPDPEDNLTVEQVHPFATSDEDTADDTVTLIDYPWCLMVVLICGNVDIYSIHMDAENFDMDDMQAVHDNLPFGALYVGLFDHYTCLSVNDERTLVYKVIR